MSGKCNVVTFRTDQRKQKFQKWHLYMSLRETNNTYIKENPKMHIRSTKFRMLCSSHVKFSSQTPTNVCTCVYHQNIILALDAMNGYSDSFPIYSSSFPIHAWLSLKMKNVGLEVVTISTVGFSITILNLTIWNRKLAGKYGRTIMSR